MRKIAAIAAGLAAAMLMAPVSALAASGDGIPVAGDGKAIKVAPAVVPGTPESDGKPVILEAKARRRPSEGALR